MMAELDPIKEYQRCRRPAPARESDECWEAVPAGIGSDGLSAAGLVVPIA